MKRNVLMSFMTAALLFTDMAHAEFAFNLGDSTTCKDIAGHWTGAGKGIVIFNDFMVKCRYEGSAFISNVDNAGNFSVQVTGFQTSDNSGCPLDFNEELTGSCSNNVVTINTILGTITGSILNDEGSAKGHLKHPYVEAEVKVSAHFTHTK